MDEVIIEQDSCYEAIDAVNKLLEDYGLKIEFKEEISDSETIYVIELPARK